jgi:hypothetical protein
MFAVKIFQNRDDRSNTFHESIETLKSYIFGHLNQSVRITDASSDVEISAGTLPSPNEDQIVAELLIKKRVVINKADFNDELELDKFLHEIKHFCEQAKSIEDLGYLPPPMREPPKDSS